MTVSVFAGAAPYYARYRAPYPDALLDHVVTEFRLDDRSAVVDVGCGTGLLAIPLARRGIRVIGIEPDDEMLAEARARTAGRLELIAGRGEELATLVTGPVALVTFAASLHWMDRETVLAACDQVVAPGGGVVVIGPTRQRVVPPWQAIVDETITEFLGPVRRAGGGRYQPPRDGHAEALARSAFARVTTWTIAVDITRTADEVAGLQLSTSFASPALLGDATDTFRRTLTDRLRAAAPTDRFEETVHLEVISGWR